MDSLNFFDLLTRNNAEFRKNPFDGLQEKAIQNRRIRCAKDVPIYIFFKIVFSLFVRNREIYSVINRTQFDYKKYWRKKTFYLPYLLFFPRIWQQFNFEHLWTTEVAESCCSWKIFIHRFWATLGYKCQKFLLVYSQKEKRRFVTFTIQ